MGADEQRFSLIAQFFQNRRILHPGARIQPGSRFIQDQKIRIVDERPRQTEALLLQQLIDADVMVSSFMREKGSLESLFMQITGHEEERAVLKHEMESGI